MFLVGRITQKYVVTAVIFFLILILDAVANLRTHGFSSITCDQAIEILKQRVDWLVLH